MAKFVVMVTLEVECGNYHNAPSWTRALVDTGIKGEAAKLVGACGAGSVFRKPQSVEASDAPAATKLIYDAASLEIGPLESVVVGSSTWVTTSDGGHEGKVKPIVGSPWEKGVSVTIFKQQYDGTVSLRFLTTPG